jgi:hypothetical protein
VRLAVPGRWPAVAIGAWRRDRRGRCWGCGLSSNDAILSPMARTLRAGLSNPACRRGGVSMSRRRSAARRGRRPTWGRPRGRLAASYRPVSWREAESEPGDCNRGRTHSIHRTVTAQGGRYCGRYFIYRPPWTVFQVPSPLDPGHRRAPSRKPRSSFNLSLPSRLARALRSVPLWLPQQRPEVLAWSAAEELR